MSDAAVWVWAQVIKLIGAAIIGGIVFAITGLLSFWAWFAIACLVVFLGVWVAVHADGDVDVS